jgi:putative oxidoreductase
VGTFVDSGDLGLVVLRLIVGLIFAAHGAQKAFGWWAGPGYAGWTGALQSMGWRPAPLWALISTAAELAGGLFLAVGFLTPLAAAALIGQSVVIVFTVHWPKGFWNAKGGWEFPISLAAGVIAIALTGPAAISLDAALGLASPEPVRLGLVALGLLGGLGSLALKRHLVPRPAAEQDG